MSHLIRLHFFLVYVQVCTQSVCHGVRVSLVQMSRVYSLWVHQGDLIEQPVLIESSLNGASVLLVGSLSICVPMGTVAVGGNPLTGNVPTHLTDARSIGVYDLFGNVWYTVQ